MPGILKSQITTYEYALSTMETLIAAELGVSVIDIEVRYIIEEVGGDPLDRYPGTKQVTKVEVKVKNK